jgi:hypothetical protein
MEEEEDPSIEQQSTVMQMVTPTNGDTVLMDMLDPGQHRL